jgi:hypothetical protein
MFGATIRAAERWRSVKVTEFERRQMAAARHEIEREYKALVGLNRMLPKSEYPALLGFDAVFFAVIVETSSRNADPQSTGSCAQAGRHA